MGNKSATVTSTTAPTQEAMKYYTEALAAGKSAASNPYQSWGKTASDYVAQINPQQTAGIAGINAAAGSYQPYLENATSAVSGAMGGLSPEAIQRYMSPYVDMVAGSTADLMKQANDQAQSGALGTAASSGAFGGDRAGIAAANLNQQNQLAMGSTMANIYNQGYGQAVSTAQQQQGVQLQGAQMLSGLGSQAQALGLAGANAQIGAGTLQQQTEQAGIDALMNNFMQEKAYPYQNAQYLAGLASSLGPLMGGTSAEKHPTNIFGNVKLATGGRVERAAGGLAGQPEQFARGYVPEVQLSSSQAEAPRVNVTSGGKSGVGEAADMAKKFMSFGMADGGRTGYYDGGAPTRGDVYDLPKAGYQVVGGGLSPNPGPLPSVSAVSVPNGGDLGREAFSPMDRPSGLRPAQPLQHPVHPDANFRANLGAAYNNMRSAEAAQAREMGRGAEPAPQRPDGLSLPVDRGPGMADLGAAGISIPSQPQGGLQPAVSPDRGAATSSGGIDPREFYRTRIIAQESGGSQFDENGKPLTSPAGAVGVGQVMEATGPEAARLAGMEWDRDRWLNDPQYNAAIGEAYFLEQYRQFGDIEKAAAAYNAGPGRVASAMDRSLVMGGTWKDYLPDETKGYISATTGSGGGSTGGGLGGGNGSSAPSGNQGGGLLGQLFGGGEGEGNVPRRDIILSLLGGLGAASQSKGNILGILASGAGGYAQTRQNLMEIGPKADEGRLANSSAFMNLYNKAKAMGYAGTAQQYAASMGMPYLAMGEQTAAPGQAAQAGAREFGGVPLDVYGGALTQVIQSPDGTPIRAGESYGYLRMLADEQQKLAGFDPAVAASLAQTQGKIAAIERANGQVLDVNGNAVVDPAYQQMQFAGNQTAADLQTSANLLTELPARQTSISDQDRRLDEMLKVATGLPTSGPFTPALASVAGAATQLGIPMDENRDMTTNYNLMVKMVADEARSDLQRLGGDTNTRAYIDNITSSTVNPTLDKGSMAEILAIKAGVNDYERGLVEELQRAAAENPSANPAAIERQYKASHPIGDFIDAARPRFQSLLDQANGGGSASTPVDGATGIDDATGKPIIFRNGDWEFQ